MNEITRSWFNILKAARDGRFFSCPPRIFLLCVNAAAALFCLCTFLYVFESVVPFHSILQRAVLWNPERLTQKRRLLSAAARVHHSALDDECFSLARPAPELVPRCRVLYQFRGGETLQIGAFSMAIHCVLGHIIHTCRLFSKNTAKIAQLAKVDCLLTLLLTGALLGKRNAWNTKLISRILFGTETFLRIAAAGLIKSILANTKRFWNNPFKINTR